MDERNVVDAGYLAELVLAYAVPALLKAVRRLRALLEGAYGGSHGTKVAKRRGSGGAVGNGKHRDASGKDYVLTVSEGGHPG